MNLSKRIILDYVGIGKRIKRNIIPEIPTNSSGRKFGMEEFVVAQWRCCEENTHVAHISRD